MSAILYNRDTKRFSLETRSFAGKYSPEARKQIDRLEDQAKAIRKTIKQKRHQMEDQGMSVEDINKALNEDKKSLNNIKSNLNKIKSTGRSHIIQNAIVGSIVPGVGTLTNIVIGSLNRGRLNRKFRNKQLAYESDNESIDRGTGSMHDYKHKSTRYHYNKVKDKVSDKIKDIKHKYNK